MAKKKVSLKSEPKLQFVTSSRELPATQGMLHLVRTELKADVSELRSEMKAGFSQVEARFNQIDSKFSQIDSKFNQVDARFNQMDSKFERVLSEVARVGVLVEEQNSNNRIVLEGLTGLWQRQERVEGRVDDVEKLVRSIGRSRS